MVRPPELQGKFRDKNQKRFSFVVSIQNNIKSKMKRIVLIGATGFVGSALLKEALDRGHEVTALVRLPSKLTIAHPHLTIVEGDVADSDFMASLMKGVDAVISAFNPGWSNPNIYQETLDGYASILQAVRWAKVPRLLIVGGAGSLNVSPGKRVMDEEGIPQKLLPGIKSLAKVYTDYLLPEKNVDWIFLSPAATLKPGQRTGTFRMGKDDLIVDKNGESTISVEDYAVAMIDELEQEKHHRERFTVGY